MAAVKKYVFGKPYDTYAIEKDIPTESVIGGPSEAGVIKEFKIDYVSNIGPDNADGIRFERALADEDIVYGLGETMHGMNKRGHEYISYNTDDPHHKDTTRSLYGSHNFLLIGDKFGVFFDTPSRVVFNIDVNDSKIVEVIAETDSLRLYIFTGDGCYDIVKKFRNMIGKSFIPPLWAFGFCQSRWGYKTAEDVSEVVDKYRQANIPLDSVCMDIDYMDRYIDFTINEKRFPNFTDYVFEMKKKGIHLVPIIDAGVKVEPGNEVYEEGVKNGFFCTNHENKPFKAAVWPGMTHFPDVFQPEARKWFGSKYKKLTDCGIEGFWNDMNEPAIFYSEYSKKQPFWDWVLSFLSKSWAERHASKESNAYKDYKNFYHLINGERVLHQKVHNLYGGLLTQAAGEGLSEIMDRRFLLFSRSSYIGAHRYGGIWTGDNNSCWEHLAVNVCQMASLNMCGFVYTGADTGGFGGNASRELLLRWLAFSDFTPLMRDHSCLGTRKQECYQFGDTEAFRKVVNLRYRLIPYIYSEFVKAVLNDEMYMRPLHFDYPDDPKCKYIDDQLMVGGDLMIAPVITKDADGRKVYLPEDMTVVRFDGTNFICNEMQAGEHEITVPGHEVVFFIKKNHAIPVTVNTVQSTMDMDITDVRLIGDGESYCQYVDDGITRDIRPENIVVLHKP